jgi:hypothetical protein
VANYGRHSDPGPVTLRDRLAVAVSVRLGVTDPDTIDRHIANAYRRAFLSLWSVGWPVRGVRGAGPADTSGVRLHARRAVLRRSAAGVPGSLVRRAVPRADAACGCPRRANAPAVGGRGE